MMVNDKYASVDIYMNLNNNTGNTVFTDEETKFIAQKAMTWIVDVSLVKS